jgi:hypothetical protein
MKNLIPLIFLLVLAGCKTDTPTNVAIKFPGVPQDIMEACPDLKTVDPNTEKLSEVLPVIVDNYSSYYECKLKVDAWIEWYNTQKSINDTVNK